jgi:site-specific recombinase XerC
VGAVSGNLDQLQIGRPTSTVIAYRTAWKDLERVAKGQGVSIPQEVTPAIVAEFVKQMRGRGLSANTAKARLAKIRYYRIALGVSPPLARTNPAEHTLGYSDHRVVKEARKRLPLDDQDLAQLFGAPIHTLQLRSQNGAKRCQ